MKTGFKWLIALHVFGIASALYSLAAHFESARYFFGVRLTFPFSAILSLVAICTLVYMIAAIVKRENWKVLVVLHGLIFLQSTTTYLFISFPKIAPRLHIGGVLVALSLCVGVLIASVPLMYVFANKEYFKPKAVN